VISRFTKDLLGPGFDVRALDRVKLRGRDTPLEVFEVVD
jgi:class 3 adenylate cyclase